jgi:hypothetical protein
MPEEKQEVSPAALPGVSRKDADVANSGPAPWSNKFVIALGPMVRVAFLEQGGPEEPPFFRGAVTMSHQDAIVFKNLLTSLLADVEKQIQAAMAKQEPPKNG